MKKFTLEIKNASPAQLSTIALELKITANNWARFGPRFTINGHEPQAPSLHEPRHKPQAASRKRHSMNTFQ